MSKFGGLGLGLGQFFERRGRKGYAKGAEKKYQKNTKLNTKFEKFT
jgi:hypothetical protein